MQKKKPLVYERTLFGLYVEIAYGWKRYYRPKSNRLLSNKSPSIKSLTDILGVKPKRIHPGYLDYIVYDPDNQVFIDLFEILFKF